jgi:hypothetical protein
MIETLEDLRIYLHTKYELEWKELDIEEILKKQDEVLSQYELNQDEYEYAAPIIAAMEEQSVEKTMINTKKAQEILLKKR